MNCNMNYNEIIAHLEAEAKKYTPEQYDLYEAEIGWEDWMNDYTEAADGEEITEAEIREINKVLRIAWNNVHRG